MYRNNFYLFQVLTMPAILERKHLLLASETGAGKTVAYLAPIIQNICSVKENTKLFPKTPLALIVTPGRELVEQIGVIKTLFSRNLKILIDHQFFFFCAEKLLSLSEKQTQATLIFFFQ